MINIQTILEIPDWIQQGLKSGEYIRFGGIIREAKTKQIVAMLREVTPDISRSLDLLIAFPYLMKYTQSNKAVYLSWEHPLLAETLK